MFQFVSFFDGIHLHREHRQLQGWEPPDYTSPPTQLALEATPEAFRSDAVIDAARNASAANECSVSGNNCQIEFHPQGFSESKVGVLFYGGALVDPRGYSPLALTLADRYGLPVVVPIFANDLQFSPGVCNTGRLEFAQAAFSNVERWIFTGHSLGGVAALLDAWSLIESTDDNSDAVGGLVLLASRVRQDLGCGLVDFSESNLPMANLVGSNDGILNMTGWEEESLPLMTQNKTYALEIIGGTHGGFGSYDDSQRFELLNQTDGELEISLLSQWDSVTSAIYNVAARSGVALPQKQKQDSSEPQDDEEDIQDGNDDDDEDVGSSSSVRDVYRSRSLTLSLVVLLWAHNQLN
jgi:hypothetical protein